MHSAYFPEDLSFRDELRFFFQSKIPKHVREKVSAGTALRADDIKITQQILNAAGLAVPHWPTEWGGRDWSPMKRAIFTEELQRAAVPLPLQFNCYMIGPVLAAFGSEAQKQRFLARAANLDDWWCQGFSEPDAGSDLASLKTKAVRTEDGYVVSGQKIWTTYAQYADWIFCLVRTDPVAKKQAGISFLLIDMKSPGVTVRPIITMDGRHEVNEVFFDEVKVPFENLVGEENKGWDYAKYLLANERAGIARIGLSKERIARVRRLARETVVGDRTLWEVETFRARVLEVEVGLKALEFTQMRVLTEADHSSNSPNPISSILKLKGSQLQQLATELLLEVTGGECFSADQDEYASAWAFETYLNFRKVSIYGGSNEIQRNIIAKSILNL